MMSAVDEEQRERERPDMDETLASIMLGYNLLSDERPIALGMSGGIQLPIPITSMACYHEVFRLTVGIQHFVRVVKSADNEFLKIQSEKQKRERKSKTGPVTSSASSGAELPSL